VTVQPARVTRWLAGVAMALILASFTGQAIKQLTGHDHLYGLIALFDVNAEANVPTYFSAAILLLAAVVLALIARLKAATEDPYRRHWGILAAAFVYMSLDEAIRIHEFLGRPTRALLGHRAGELVYFAWIIPGAAIMLAFALSFLRFALHLPARTRWRTFMAATLFTGGALGGEVLGGQYARLYGEEGFGYLLIVTLEEGLEMAGVVLWIDTLLRYLAEHYGELRLRFGSPRGD
jgi:DMSO/TMAO reductase YedYZ heme-binding membrane subunit